MISTVARAYEKHIAEYEAGRPEYPVKLLADLPPSEVIVDLGAGTGKFTRLLALLDKNVIAVEPLPEMAKRIPVQGMANAKILICSAEQIPLPDSTADMICCATAFHWFNYQKATAEIVRILKRGGYLALVWNIRDDRVSWVARLSKILDHYAKDTPRQSSGKWRAIFDDDRFDHISSKAYSFPQKASAEAIMSRVLSTSFIASLPKSEQMSVQAAVEGILRETPELSNAKEVTFPYMTELHIFRTRFS